MLTEIGKRAKAASKILAPASEEIRVGALKAIADELLKCTDEIIAENEKDLIAGKAAGLSDAMLDRLMLDGSRIRSIADGVLHVASLPDPLGRVFSDFEHANGMHIKKVSVPMGVIGIIFESRPNVSVDSAVLCIKAGSAVILRGGKEAILSNTVLVKVMRRALASVGLPEDCVCLVEDTSRDSATELMQLKGYVDLLIPRGGAGLISAVVKGATVPVIETGAGTCHVYVDKAADIDMAAEIIYNAKTSRPSVCNAAECMLIHKDIAEAALPVICEKLKTKNVEIRGDETVCRIISGISEAEASDWGREYNDYIIAARVVDSIDTAISHIAAYGTGHSECIVTADSDAAQKFIASVDAAAVYHNVSTRFTDGGEFGLGAEIGISTQKLHARGPLGLNELTTMKYIVTGNGQIR